MPYLGKCPTCGSTKLIRHGKQWRLNRKQGKMEKNVQRYRCSNCGRFTVHPERGNRTVVERAGQEWQNSKQGRLDS